jgi:hypothetical protein
VDACSYARVRAGMTNNGSRIPKMILPILATVAIVAPLPGCGRRAEFRRSIR